MRPTPRWWTIAGTGVVLLVIAVIGQRPLALTGAASVGAFCLVSAARAVSAFTDTQSALDLDVEASPPHVSVEGDTTVSISVSLDSPARHPITVEVSFPVGVEGEMQMIRVSPGETQAEGLASPVFPIVGRFALPELNYTFESPDGLFTQRLPCNKRTTVSVEARGVQNMHVGGGGEQLVGSVGGRAYDELRADIGDFESLREYTLGDSVRRIDWKSTARLDEVYVREYETEREVSTRVIIDNRSRLNEGEPGRKKLDYLREVAFSLIQTARSAEHPLGITIVDEGGIRLNTNRGSTRKQYAQAREAILRLGSDSNPSEQIDGTMTDESLENAQAIYRTLKTRAENPTPFVTTLRPVFSRSGSYFARLSGDPLFKAIRRNVREASPETWTVLLTDDAKRRSIEEAVKLAASGTGRVTVFITPKVLFEPTNLIDLESAYSRLVEFEEFRRRLERIPGVTAYEVGPAERINALLAQSTGGNPKRRHN